MVKIKKLYKAISEGNLSLSEFRTLIEKDDCRLGDFIYKSEDGKSVLDYLIKSKKTEYIKAIFEIKKELHLLQNNSVEEKKIIKEIRRRIKELSSLMEYKQSERKDKNNKEILLILLEQYYSRNRSGLFKRNYHLISDALFSYSLKNQRFFGLFSRRIKNEAANLWKIIRQGINIKNNLLRFSEDGSFDELKFYRDLFKA